MASTYMEKNLDAEMAELEDEESDSDSAGKESDEGEDGAEEDPQLQQKIAGLEAEIKQNPYNYSAHVDLVTAIRQTEEFVALRAARQRFSEIYPLTPELWIDWTRDEQKIAGSEEDRETVRQLFERGTKDYVSVDLWLEYCQFSLGGIGTAEGVAQARATHEAALTACGRHVAKGALVWEAYREFEAALLSLMPAAGSGEVEEARAEQAGRVERLWCRQLRQPLLGMDTAYQEYSKQAGGNVNQLLTVEYKKAREGLKKREPYESALLTEDEAVRLESYTAYLDWEQQQGGDPVMLQQLHERAVGHHCLQDQLWLRYTTYLSTEIKIPQVCLPVFERATRNVPWCGEVWCDYLRCLERLEQPHAEVKRVFQQGLAADFPRPESYLQLWLAFIDYQRRRTEWGGEGVTESMSDLRNTFQRANEHLGRCGGDPGFCVSKYWANLEADQFGSMENARKLWAEITAAIPYQALVWLEYIQLEKTFGDKKHLRKCYQRALEKTFDDPETIVKSFSQFEREEGSLEAWDHCQKLCRLKMERTAEARSKEEAKKEAEEETRAAKLEKKKEKDKQWRRDKRQNEAAEKRVGEAGSASVARTQGQAGTGPSKLMPPPGFPGVKRSIAPPPGFKQPPSKKAKPEEEADGENLSEEEEKKNRTVFLSNLAFKVTEEEIQSFLRSSGAINEVRLVRKPSGESKGFAFVEFNELSSARTARARDNEMLGGRPVYISECDPEKKRDFKYDTGLEKAKLFVKGIHPEVTKAELSELFSKFGKLKDVRLPLKKNGQVKGIAFVDFEEETAAAAALVKTDNMLVRGSEIQVALSNPPKKETGPAAGSSEPVRSLGGTVGEFGPRGRGRSQLAFTPRSVSVPAKPPAKLQPMVFVKPAANGSTNGNSNGNSNGNNSSESSSKSNADFRKMLLK